MPTDERPSARANGQSGFGRHPFNSTTGPQPIQRPQRPQRQDSTFDQMRTVLRLATEAGCYDAADWIVANWPALDPYRSSRVQR